MNSSIFFNKAFRFAALASAVALGAFGASSSFAAPATASSTATVITPITITNNTDLIFGRFAASSTAGTVIIDTAGARTSTDGVILSTADTTPSAATFEVTGDKDATYSIGLANTGLTDSTGGGLEMALAPIIDLNGGGNVVTVAGNVNEGILSSDVGKQTIHLGGILSVAVDQLAGDYTGTVTATVEYN